MAYTVKNFKTKKELKEQVALYKAFGEGNPPNDQKITPVRCYNPGLGPDLSNYTGKVVLEGPHYPEPHRWHAQAELVDGVVVKVS